MAAQGCSLAFAQYRAGPTHLEQKDLKSVSVEGKPGKLVGLTWSTSLLTVLGAG